jgi:ribonuclease VapC
MVIDSSALVAILLAETEAAHFTAAIGKADNRLLSAVNYVETIMVIAPKLGNLGIIDLDL